MDQIHLMPMASTCDGHEKAQQPIPAKETENAQPSDKEEHGSPTLGDDTKNYPKTHQEIHTIRNKEKTSHQKPKKKMEEEMPDPGFLLGLS